MTVGDTSTPWWIGTVGYEVYARSFADANGDGIGDLGGIRDRLEHLAWLGVDAIWITPFYESPGFDHGYDVADYVAINPIHGTMADFDALVEEAHRLGLRMIVDIVPNHSSSHHVWFEEALKGPGNPYRDYYIWRDPAPDGGPPNNWVSHFGGPAWTLDEKSGQYYCHLFLPEQPDLNWDNPKVAEEFDRILEFWCDKGVDGFRVDVAHTLKKDPQFRDNPRRRQVEDPDDPWEGFTSFEHKYDVDQDGTVDIFRRWNKVVAPYGAVLIGEVSTTEPERIARYVSDGTALHTLFYLKPSWMHWEPEELIAPLRAVHELAPHAISWVINNHDNSRSTTRFGGGRRGAERSLAVLALLLGLGGMPFIYQGEELGIGDGVVAPVDLEDPIATRNEGAVGRDGARTAMPWTPGPGNGFTSAATAWLPAAPRPAAETVAGQRQDEQSFLNRVRRLLAIRKARPELWLTKGEWLNTQSDPVGAIVRASTAVVANLDAIPHTVDLPPGTWSIAFESRDGATEVRESRIAIAAETSVILERD